MNRTTIDESPHARLPGRLCCRQGRWWWNVQLPGEKASRSRALKPEGSRSATADRQIAEDVAFQLWQEAMRAEAKAAARAEQAAQMQRLRVYFQDRLKALRDGIARAEARAESQTAERLKLEARLNGLRSQLTQMAPCECCGRRVPRSDLQPIDSSQRLCRSCLDDLRRAEQRQPPRTPKAQDETRQAGLPDRRDVHGPDVLYAQAGRR